MKADLYARFSTDKQRDASIDDRYRECERAAKGAALDVVARFEDRSISAGTATRRGYRALLTAARRHEFDVIVCEDISRLWRNRAEFGPRSAELEDLGVHCLTCVGMTRGGMAGASSFKSSKPWPSVRGVRFPTGLGADSRAIRLRVSQRAGSATYGYVSRAMRVGAARLRSIRSKRPLCAGIGAIRQRHGAAGDRSHVERGRHRITRSGLESDEERRRDRKWLASAIHGDVNRGTGILNNRRYVGVVVWARSDWKRWRRTARSDARPARWSVAGCASERLEQGAPESTSSPASWSVVCVTRASCSATARTTPAPPIGTARPVDSLNVPRKLVQDIMLAGMQGGLA